jgi:hypothetical protein
LIFDWQYFNGVEETSKTFTERGFEVVGASTLHVYNATWLHIEKSEENVRAIVDDGNKLGLKGSCLTTWECGLFGAFDTLLPAIKASGRIAKGEDTTILDEYKALSRDHGRWAEFMGIELEEIGKPFTFIGIRSSLKARFLLYGNPFLAWMHLHEDLAGETGEKALAIFEKAMQAAPGEAEKGVTIFARGAVEFVRLADEAAKLYAQRKPEAAVAKLASTRMIFDDLEKVAQKSYERIGGSLADIERCRTCKQHVETVIKRIRDYGNDELGYLPAFEVITNHKFMPHDQANWWLINRWANE